MPRMKYTAHKILLTPSQRQEFNEKILRLLDGNFSKKSGITGEVVYNAYTGNGGLHGLNREQYENYHQYSQAKKEIENGQFFTSPDICRLVADSLNPGAHDLIADFTCGIGHFFNFMPVEANLYGCEIDPKAYKVARFLYPDAKLSLGDIRTYDPGTHFDYVVGNPPFNLRWHTQDGLCLSQFYYCIKAASLLKPMGILALIVPQSFLSDSFSDSAMIRQMEEHFSFLGQITLPEDAFIHAGVSKFPTKLQFWQKISSLSSQIPRPYSTTSLYSLTSNFDPTVEASRLRSMVLSEAIAQKQNNRGYIFLELAQNRDISSRFIYQTKKLLYQIKVHPKTCSKYNDCFNYLHRFTTQKKPKDMDYEEWQRKKLTEKKVLSYLRHTLKGQNKKPPKDIVALVKQDYSFQYKAYSVKARQMLPPNNGFIPVYQAVIDNNPQDFPGFEDLLKRKRREYDMQNQVFRDMGEDPFISEWLKEFTLWDAENEEVIQLNTIQKQDINRILQKKYGMLQWEQGSGKTLAAIATAIFRMELQGIYATWVVSSAISIRNNWDVVLNNYGLPYVFVNRLKDLSRIRAGNFVLITLNKLGEYHKQIKKWIKMHGGKIGLVLDESDEISNPYSVRAKAALDCFRRCRTKLLTTGTSTRNNISEFAPQLELLYNNSINMISWCQNIYRFDPDSKSVVESGSNDMYGMPIPAYKKGYALFSSCHLPEKPTVFGIDERTQDIYNADALDEMLSKTVITRTFEEITGREIRRIHQVPLRFAPSERAVYAKVVEEFEKMCHNYFASTGNRRKDAGLKLMRQITLLLRVSAAPNTLSEYTGDTPVKIMAAVDMATQWENEIVAIGVRHKAVLDAYAAAFKKYLPDRPLFTVTGDTTSFAKRRALQKTLKESQNGILICTQQSLPSSVNFEYVNKIIIPELHYNNARMSQFYMRFVRFTSTEFKDIYFLTYANSLESNLMQMVVAKEKINLFMKGQDTDLDDIYKKFGIDYNLMSLLMRRERDEKGHFRIRWGEQKIA